MDVDFIWQKNVIGLALVNSKGQWVAANPALCNLLGYTESELLERDFQQITHPLDLDADLKALEQLNNKQIDFYTSTKRYITKSQSIVWIHLTVYSFIMNNEIMYFCQINKLDFDKDIEIKSPHSSMWVIYLLLIAILISTIVTWFN